MSYSKIRVINDALLASGNNACTTEDGSDEWVAASNAYERYLPQLLRKGNWKFSTGIAELARLGASTFPGFSDIYEKPANCAYLVSVWESALGEDVQDIPVGVIPRLGTLPPALAYRVIGDTIHCSAPEGVTAMFVETPAEGDWPADFAEALTLKVEAMLHRGLNEDYQASELATKLAMNEVSEARVRGDQEEPKRTAFRSKTREARRTQRRW